MDEKLKVLVACGVLEPASETFVRTVWKRLDLRLPQLPSKDLEVFLTHLALAHTRMMRQEPLGLEVEEAFCRAVLSHSRFKEVQSLWKALDPGSAFSQQEELYIYQHLLMLLEGDRHVFEDGDALE